MELYRWPALVVGFFGCLLGFSGGILVVGFGCGVESVAGFGGGFFWCFLGFSGGVSVVELNQWQALVVGFFGCLLDPFGGGFRCLVGLFGGWIS